MDERNWERIGASAGIAFVVLTVLGAFLYPQQPRVDSSAATTLHWVHSHRTAIETGMVLGAFAGGLFLWFVAFLRTALSRAERGSDRLASIVFGSGVAGAAMGLLGLLPNVVLAFMDAQRGGLQDPTIVRMLGDLNSILFGIGVPVLMVFLTALGIGMLGGLIGSRWLGWLSLVAAACNAISVVTSLTFSTYHGAIWTIPAWAAFLGFVVVVLVLSVMMLRRAGQSTEGRPAAMAAA
jgi:hypothetical protein